MKKFLVLISLIPMMAMLSCAGSSVNRGTDQEIKSAMDYLVSLQGALDTLANSEYAACANAGDLTDDLVRKICSIAQSASAELQTELLAQIGVMANNLQAQIDQINTDLANESVALNTRIDNANAAIAAIAADIADLNTRMTSIEAAITAINAYNDATDLPGSMEIILVGEDNITSGPVFESVVRRKDQSRFLAFVESWGAANPIDGFLSRTASSAVVTVHSTGSAYQDGDIVKISGVASSVVTGMMDTVAVVNSGSGYAVGNVLTIGGGGTGGTVTVATITDTGKIATAVLNAGGLGYVVNDILTVNDGAGAGGTVKVTSTGAGGVVTGISLTAIGSAYTAAVGVATTGGSGAGCTVDITTGGEIDTLDPITTEGSGYVVGTYATTGGAGSRATIQVATVTSNNLISSDFNGKSFSVIRIDDDTFTITLPKTATNTDATFGGGAMTATKLTGRHMQEIWGAVAGQASDLAVRTTSTGSVPYNFIIKRLVVGDPTKAALCYDKTDPNALFATIDANCPAGGGNIVSK